MKAAAEPRPDNPDNEPESSIELLREPAMPDVRKSCVERDDLIGQFVQHRDPLIGVLDYIAEVSSCIMRPDISPISPSDVQTRI